jgi:hypothetical protein
MFMTNLENMLNEKENKMSKIRSSIAQNLVREEEKYKAKVEDINSEGLVALNSLDHDYAPKLTESLIADLTNDSQIMIERANYSAIPKEKIEEALKIKESLSELKSSKRFKSRIETPLNNLLQYLPQETKDLINLPDIEKVKKQETITTYIISNSNGCYVLAPVTDKPSDRFSKDVEEKILGVLNVGKVGAGKETVFFKGDGPEYVHNFMMFKIDTSHPDYVAKELIKRFNNEHIQPQSFKDGNIIHKVVPLEYGLFKNFLNYRKTQEELELEQNVPQVKKKMGRPLGSKTKKSIDTKMHENHDLNNDDFRAMGNNGDTAGNKSLKYDQFKEKYDALTEKYGHPPTRTELNWNQREFYKEMKEAESKYGKFDFIPNLRLGKKYGPRSDSKKKD